MLQPISFFLLMLLWSPPLTDDIERIESQSTDDLIHELDNKKLENLRKEKLKGNLIRARAQ